MRSDRKEVKPVIDPTIQNVTGKFLTEAVEWFNKNEIKLYKTAIKTTTKKQNNYEKKNEIN